MGGITFGLYLGANTVSPATDLCRGLSSAAGVAVSLDPGLGWAERDRQIRDGSAGIVWACGLWTTELLDAGRADLEIVAAPVFPGREGATYRSVVIARVGESIGGGAVAVGGGAVAVIAESRGLVLAVNGRDSWSGFHALRVHLAEAGRRESPFDRIVETGGHDGSIEAVLDGRADVAAIDDTIWAERVATDRRLDALRVVERTRPWPAPPISVSRSIDGEVRSAIVAALPEQRPMGLRRIVPASSADYDVMRRGVAVSRELGW